MKKAFPAAIVVIARLSHTSDVDQYLFARQLVLVVAFVGRDEFAFGYYWNPTSLVGKLGLTQIPWETPFVGNEHWDSCIVKPEQECADPQPSAYVESEVNTVVTDSFMKKSSVAAEYLGKRVFPGEVMNAMLVYMADEQASGADAAVEFLKTQGDVWKAWVPADVAAKVEAAL